MTDNTEHAQVGWGFWLRWVLASTAVLAVGRIVGMVGISLGISIGVFVWALIGVVIGAVSGAVFGAAVGIAQRSVLRREVSWWSGGWTVGSAGGGAVGFAVSVAMVLKLDLVRRAGELSLIYDNEAATVLGIVVVIGASLGIAQWLTLRQHMSGSGLWVLASTLGPAVIYLVVFYVSLFTLDRIEGFSERTSTIRTSRDGILIEERVYTYDDPQKVIDGAVFGGVVGAVLGYGAITGGALVWLLRQPEETEFKLDRRTRTRLLLAAVFLIVLMAGYFVFATIKANNAAIEANNAAIEANNIIAGLKVPPCSEVYIAPLIRDRRVTTCHIKRANCVFNGCSDGPFESPSFALVRAYNSEFRLDNFDGECLLVTGEAHMRRETPAMFVYDQSDVEICQ